MSVIPVFQRQLATAHETSERYLEDFKTPEQWTYQVHDTANHALWFAGHMGQTDNFLISLIAPEKAVTKEGWSENFGMGSRPTSDPEAAALTKLGPERLYVHIRDRVLRDHGDDVVFNRCPACDRVACTPRAQQCFHCGHDWHGESSEN